MRSAFVTLLLLAGVAHADPRALAEQARRAEGEFRWTAALELYGQLIVAGDRTAADRWQPCLRRVQQAERWAAPDYRPALEPLPLAAALDTLGEALGKLQAHYVDRHSLVWAKLERAGRAEVDWLLRDPATRGLAGVEPMAADAFRDWLRERPTLGPASTPGDVREVVRLIAVAAQQTLGLAPALVVGEWLVGAFAALDDYSQFLDAGAADHPRSLRARLDGLGVRTRWDGAALVVEAVATESWGDRRGVQPGDRVVRVGRAELGDGTPRRTAELNAAAADAGDIDLASGGMVRTLPLPREWPSVGEPRPLDPTQPGLVLLPIRQFQRGTAEEVESAVLALRMMGLTGLALDLRGCPGGSLAAAVQLADKLLPGGTVTVTQGDGRDASRAYPVSGAGGLTDVPLVVLIDGHTASAAEVLASALKENGRARLVGQPTRGKGTVQNVFLLRSGAGVKLTLARLFTARGEPLAAGVTPHDAVMGREAQRLAAVAALTGRP